MRYQVIKGNKKNTLSINKNSAKKLGVESKRESLIRFGYKVLNIEVRIDETLEDNIIVLCERIVKRLGIPSNNIHQINDDHGEIIFGPYIGIYLGTGHRNIKWKYERLTSFILNHSEVKGTVCAFTAKEMNFEKLEVDAYYYDTINDVWKKKRMPFPTVIHRYGDFNKKFSRKLRALYGHRLFNYSEMDKWNELSILKSELETCKYIPDTIKCQNEDVFKNFINKHRDVYFKPILGRKGRGIFRIKQNDPQKITLTTQKDNRSINLGFSKLDDLVKSLYKEITSGDYLLQKTINLMVDGRMIDFRVRFDKDIDDKWNLTIFAARVSEKGAVVSNRSAGGKVITPDKALIEYYNYNHDEINEVKQRMLEVALKLTKTIEKSHMPYGKCAIDLGLDLEGNIYHIESNVKAPNDLTTRVIDGYKSLDRACQLNSLYSKKLSGFKNVANEVSLDRNYNKLSKRNRKYGIYFAGSLENVDIVNIIKQEFKDTDLPIKIDRIAKRYIRVLTRTNEKNLIKIVNRIKAEQRNAIRTVLYYQIRKSSNKVQNEISLLKETNESLRKELDTLKNSTSWKLSKPIRILGNLYKK